MIGKDLSKLENLIKQLKTAREKEISQNKKINNTTNTTNVVTNSIFNSSNIVEN